jgi:hypothetical protein
VTIFTVMTSSQNSFVDEIGLFPGSWGSLTEQVPKSRTKNRTLAKNGVYGGFWKNRENEGTKTPVSKSSAKHRGDVITSSPSIFFLFFS